MPTSPEIRCRYLQGKQSKIFRNVFTSLHGVIPPSDGSFKLVSCMYVVFLHEIEICLNCNRLKCSGNYVTFAVTQTLYFATERFYVCLIIFTVTSGYFPKHHMTGWCV